MKLGPYEANKIYCGECAEMMRALPEGCIDLVVTSPPYDNLREYNGYVFDFEAIACQLWRVIKPGGVVVWVVADETKNGSETGTSFRQALGFMGLGFKLHDTMIYARQGRFPNSNRYWQDFEYMFVFSKGAPVTFNPLKEKTKYPGLMRGERQKNGDIVYPKHRRSKKSMKSLSNVWRIIAGGGVGQKDKIAYQSPATFPEPLARDHILSWSNPGDIVLDPMVGSGTTAKMAMLTGRHYLGFDISQEYVDLAKERLARYEAQPFLTGLEPAKVGEQLNLLEAKTHS